MPDNSDWIDDLYSEGQDEQPPAELDERIRAAARREIRRPWLGRRGRLTALATAASLVIAAMVVYYAPTEPPTAENAGRLMGPEPAAGRATSSPGIDSLGEDAALEAGLQRASDRDQPLPAPVTAAAPAAPAPAAPAQALEKSVPLRRLQGDGAGRNSNLASADSGFSERPAEGNSVIRAERAAARVAPDQGPTADVQAQLADLCGPLPGTADNRRLDADVHGWYLTVTAGGDARFWRCQDGAWIEIHKSEEPVR